MPIALVDKLLQKNCLEKGPFSDKGGNERPYISLCNSRLASSSKLHDHTVLSSKLTNTYLDHHNILSSPKHSSPLNIRFQHDFCITLLIKVTYSMNWTKHCVAHLTQIIWYKVNVGRFYPILLPKYDQHYTLLFAQQNRILCNMYGVRVFASYNILSPPIQSPLSSKLSTIHGLRWETLLSSYSSWSFG